MKTGNCELWLCVDSNGDYAVGCSEEQARERFAEDIGALEETSGFRLVRLDLTVALPEVLELAATVPDTDGPVALVLA